MSTLSCTDQRVARFAAALILSLIAVPAAAARPIVVGTGTPESCSEGALQLALLTATEENGGLIQFDCGTAPASISIGHLLPGEARLARLILPNHTVVDGGGLITLDGGTRDGILVLVSAGASAEIRNATVRGGPFGPAVLNFGALQIDHCTIRDNVFGGIWNAFGDLRVRNSLFTRNGTFAGGDGAILNLQGRLTVDHTTFAANAADVGGAGIDNFGIAIVRNSVFAGNSGHWRGGAFLNNRNAEATIENCEFSRNYDGVDGGALSNEGALVVRNSLIADNITDFFGGGLYAGKGSVTTLSNTLVTRNRTMFGRGGGIYRAPGSTLLTMIATTVSGNYPEEIAP